jgi:hypothetical protein
MNFYLEENLQNVWKDEASSGTPEPTALDEPTARDEPTVKEPVAQELTPDITTQEQSTHIAPEVLQTHAFVDPLSTIETPEQELMVEEEHKDVVLAKETPVVPLNTQEFKPQAQNVWDPLNQVHAGESVYSQVVDLINPFGAMLVETPDVNLNSDQVNHETEEDQENKEVIEEKVPEIMDPLSVDNLEESDYEVEEVVVNKTQFNFNVAVMEPVKVGDTLSAHVLYKVRTQVILVI